ncbi:MAG TPA: FTR1 family protein [Mycobacteriales bacterium]
MTESFLIALREGFEAALVVSIVLAYTRRTADTAATRAIWVGTAAALAVAAVAGVVLHLTIDGLTGDARARSFAAICVAAGALLTWMIFWMRTHGRQLKAHLEEKTATAVAGGSAFGLAAVAFAAVIREGLETALFLLSTTASSDGGAVVAGTLLGLAVAALLGVLLYKGSSRINIRRFFQITGALLILFAAGLVAKTVLFLQATGDLGSFNDAVYNLTRYRALTGQTQVGRFLSGIFGWDPRPSIEQVVAYLAYLIPVSWLYFRNGAPKPPPRVPADQGAALSTTS